MAIVNDPDQLTLGQEIVLHNFDNPALGRKIQLISTGNVDIDDGVESFALFSWDVKTSKTDNQRKNHEPFIDSIDNDAGKFVLIDCEFYDQATVELLRNGGFEVIINGDTVERYAGGAVSLDFNDNQADQGYILQESGGSTSNLAGVGRRNHPIKYFGDDTHGDFDYSSFLQFFVRPEGKIFGFYDVIANQPQFASGIKPLVIQVPYQSGGNDSNKVNTDAEIASAVSGGDGIYSAMTFKKLSSGTDYSISTDSGMQTKSFDEWEIDFSSVATAQQIYSMHQYKLRQSGNINDDLGGSSIVGETLPPIMEYKDGKLVGARGVVFINVPASEQANVIMYDETDSVVVFKYESSYSIVVDSLGQSDETMYVTIFDAATYNTDNEQIILDASGAPMDYLINGNAITEVTYDHDANGDKLVRVVWGGAKKGGVKRNDYPLTLGRTKTGVININTQVENNYVDS